MLTDRYTSYTQNSRLFIQQFNDRLTVQILASEIIASFFKITGQFANFVSKCNNRQIDWLFLDAFFRIAKLKRISIGCWTICLTKTKESQLCIRV